MNLQVILTSENKIEIITKYIQTLEEELKQSRQLEDYVKRKYKVATIKRRIQSQKNLLNQAIQNIIPFQLEKRYKPKTGYCYGKCVRFVGASRGAGHIGRLGSESCRCRHCNCYFPLYADYIQIQKQINGSDKIRCPCCNMKLALVARTNLRKIRVQEMEAEGKIKRI